MRSGRASRHRRLKSPVSGPLLPPLDSRRHRLMDRVASTSTYLKNTWSPELDDVTVLLSDMPVTISDHDPRFTIDRPQRTIVFHRLPIERSADMREADPLQRQMMVEYCVFSAFAELTGREPWEMSGEGRPR